MYTIRARRTGSRYSVGHVILFDDERVATQHNMDSPAAGGGTIKENEM